MKFINYKMKLLAAVSVVAIATALPASAQQKASDTKAPTAISKSNTDLGKQNELKSKIDELKEAQSELKGASKSKVRSLKTQVRQDLDSLKRDLSAAGDAVSDTAMKELNEAIDEALKTFDKRRAGSSDLAMALDPVITELQELDRTQTAKADAKSMGDPQRSAQAGQQGGTDVKVKEKAPKVQVQQPAPKVQVQQPSPKVTIQQAKPEVIINQSKPDVKVIQAEPKVTVEKSGEPKVTVEQEGDPTVKVKEAEADKGTEAGRQADRSKPDQDRPVVSDRPQEQTPQTADRQPANPEVERLREMGRTLVGKTIYGANNDDVGEIENVVMKDGEVTSVLVDVGGFLGLGQKRIAIPLERLKMENNRLTTAMTKEEAEALPAYQE